MNQSPSLSPCDSLWYSWQSLFGRTHGRRCFTHGVGALQSRPCLGAGLAGRRSSISVGAGKPRSVGIVLPLLFLDAGLPSVSRTRGSRRGRTLSGTPRRRPARGWLIPAEDVVLHPGLALTKVRSSWSTTSLSADVPVADAAGGPLDLLDRPPSAALHRGEAGKRGGEDGGPGEVAPRRGPIATRAPRTATGGSLGIERPGPVLVMES